jgi:hypothetical protein
MIGHLIANLFLYLRWWVQTIVDLKDRISGADEMPKGIKFSSACDERHRGTRPARSFIVLKASAGNDASRLPTQEALQKSECGWTGILQVVLAVLYFPFPQTPPSCLIGGLTRYRLARRPRGPAFC